MSVPPRGTWRRCSCRGLGRRRCQTPLSRSSSLSGLARSCQSGQTWEGQEEKVCYRCHQACKKYKYSCDEPLESSAICRSPQPHAVFGSGFSAITARALPVTTRTQQNRCLPQAQPVPSISDMQMLPYLFFFRGKLAPTFGGR